MEESKYIPGTCNIGKKEMINRRNAAIVEGILGVLLSAALMYFNTNKLWRLSVFPLMALFFIGIQQWYYKFCAAFGLKGVFNFGEQLGKVTSVEEKEMLKADRNKALKILITGVILGLAVTLGFYLV